MCIKKTTTSIWVDVQLQLHKQSWHLKLVKLDQQLFTQTRLQLFILEYPRVEKGCSFGTNQDIKAMLSEHVDTTHLLAMFIQPLWGVGVSSENNCSFNTATIPYYLINIYFKYGLDIILWNSMWTSTTCGLLNINCWMIWQMNNCCEHLLS